MLLPLCASSTAARRSWRPGRWNPTPGRRHSPPAK